MVTFHYASGPDVVVHVNLFGCVQLGVSNGAVKAGYDGALVTQVAKLGGFYAAEDYHQNYLAHHPNQAYIVINDMPKLDALKKQFPTIYTD